MMEAITYGLPASVIGAVRVLLMAMTTAIYTYYRKHTSTSKDSATKHLQEVRAQRQNLPWDVHTDQCQNVKRIPKSATADQA